MEHDELAEEPNATDGENSEGDEVSATIWDELNKWGKSLEDWQRFIVSHAVRDGIYS